jgi:hypothetical protein
MLIDRDATSPQVLEALMATADGTLAQLVLTDEPYNVPIAGHVSGKGHRELPIPAFGL